MRAFTSFSTGLAKLSTLARSSNTNSSPTTVNQLDEERETSSGADRRDQGQ